MNTMRYISHLLFLVLLTFLVSCGKKRWQVPEQSVALEREARLYPDYTDVVIPPNIAPLNFMLEDSAARAMVVQLEGEKGGQLVTGSGDELRADMDTTEWRQLLAQNRGASIQVTVYAKHDDGKWVSYMPHTIWVAEEEIDGYLSYRLIEPGYELYRQLGLYQRNLSNWDEKPIYENNRSYDDEHNHCINCHNYQNYSTRNMLFHVRAEHGGTMIVRDGEPKKVQIKGDSILTSGVYPSWHPTLPLVALSTNKTGQAFHMKGRDKLEVMDEASDLLLYDVENNTVSMVLNDTLQLETFPCWSPDGQWLYYCVAQEPSAISDYPDSLMGLGVMRYHDSLFYDIRRMPFDERTRTFGPSEMVVDLASQMQSASFPRISPDGRYLLWAQAEFGQFHIWHQTADLWVKDLKNDSIYALTDANSPEAESYHTWSSNGRWIVFSSRRMDGNYTRPFIAYFDKKGRAHKAFCLPQRDPEQNLMLLKSYNVPELTKDVVRTTPAQLRKVIYEQEGELAKNIKATN